MEPYILWFAAAGALIAVELMTGTFYLLMIAAGAAMAALIALSGVGMVGQFICAALVSVAGCAYLRMRGIGSKQGGEKTNIAFDAGQSVEVIERRADGTLRGERSRHPMGRLGGEWRWRRPLCDQKNARQ